jgi:hypothetical protein
MSQHPIGASFHGRGHLSVGAMVELRPSITMDIRRRPESVDIVHPAQRAGPPRLCEFILCMAVESEFQKDRLGDFQERFNDLWVPKFGRRAAVVVYVWHVLRQARLIDWFIRAFGWGDPL